MNTPAIKLLNKYQQPNKDVHGVEIIRTDIPISDDSVHLCITVEDRMATLADIVPLARAICDRLLSAFSEMLDERGQTISCRNECDACCSYLVPLSFSEVSHLRQELLFMPADSYDSILQGCVASAKRIFEAGIENLDCSDVNSQNDTDRLNKWYAELEMSCPFLSKGSCSIYEQRPLACREHMVTGCSAACRSLADNGPEVVQMPFSVLEALGRLEAELGHGDIEAVILPLGMILPDEQLRHIENKWSAPIMVRHFIDILKMMAEKNSDKSFNFLKPMLSQHCKVE